MKLRFRSAMTALLLVPFFSPPSLAEDLEVFQEELQAEYEAFVETADPPCDPREPACEERAPGEFSEELHNDIVDYYTNVAPNESCGSVSPCLCEYRPGPEDDFVVTEEAGFYSAQEEAPSAIEEIADLFDGNWRNETADEDGICDACTKKNWLSVTLDEYACASTRCEIVFDSVFFGTRSLVTCAFSPGHVSNGTGGVVDPASYPMLLEADEQAEFEEAILQSLNRIRRTVRPRPDTRLPRLVWDAELAQIASSADFDTISTGQYVFRDDLTRGSTGEPVGESVWFANRVVTNAGRRAVWRWARSRFHYDIRTNECTSTTCGEYTQVVDERTTAVGCRQTWRRGNTAVVCVFDNKNADGREHIDQPYVPRAR